MIEITHSTQYRDTVCGIWYMANGTRYMVYDMLYMAYGIWYAVCCIWYPLVYNRIQWYTVILYSGIPV